MTQGSSENRGTSFWGVHIIRILLLLGSPCSEAPIWGIFTQTLIVINSYYRNPTFLPYRYLGPFRLFFGSTVRQGRGQAVHTSIRAFRAVRFVLSLINLFMGSWQYCKVSTDVSLCGWVANAGVFYACLPLSPLKWALAVRIRPCSGLAAEGATGVRYTAVLA